MGNDYCNLQVFCAEPDREAFRTVLVGKIRSKVLHHLGYREAPDPNTAQRTIAVGPPGRWVAVYDSAFGPGHPGTSDPEIENDLASLLSWTAPVLSVVMHDDAIVWLTLHRAGDVVDRFAQAPNFFERWPSTEAASRYRGVPGLWEDLLLPPTTLDDLTEAWERWREIGYCGSEVLEDGSRLFGWVEDLVRCGFVVAGDDSPVSYEEYLGPTDKSSTGFETLSFQA